MPKKEPKRDASGRYGGVKNAGAYAKMMAQLDDETASADKDKHKTTAELIAEERARNEKKLEEMRIQAEIAAGIEAERQAKIHAETVAKKQAEEEAIEQAKRDAELEAIRELERRTKKFYNLGRYNRKVDTGVMYFGDFEQTHGAWVAHGYGEFRTNGEVIYDGEIFHGQMQGTGMIKFVNDGTLYCVTKSPGLWRVVVKVAAPLIVATAYLAPPQTPTRGLFSGTSPMVWDSTNLRTGKRHAMRYIGTASACAGWTNSFLARASSWRKLKSRRGVVRGETKEW